MWNLLQTNDDHGKKPIDERRPWANSLLRYMKQDAISVAGMWEFLKSAPLFNPYKNAFSTVMVPATGYFETASPHQTVQQIESLLLHGDSLKLQRKQKQQSTLPRMRRGFPYKQTKRRLTLNPGITISSNSKFDDASAGATKVQMAKHKLRGALPNLPSDASFFLQLLLETRDQRNEL